MDAGAASDSIRDAPRLLTKGGEFLRSRECLLPVPLPVPIKGQLKGGASVTGSDPCFGVLEAGYAEYLREAIPCEMPLRSPGKCQPETGENFCRNRSVSGPQASLRYTSVIENESRLTATLVRPPIENMSVFSCRPRSEGRERFRLATRFPVGWSARH